MREKMNKFMMGRYGSDQYNRFLVILALVFFVFSVLGLRIFYLFGLACLIYAYFRMLSQNIYKRSLENNKYLRYEYKVKHWFSGLKWNIRQRKTHHIYRCPSCKQKIRVPRGKGRIEIRCPKCSQTFIKKS